MRTLPLLTILALILPVAASAVGNGPAADDLIFTGSRASRHEGATLAGEALRGEAASLEKVLYLGRVLQADEGLEPFHQRVAAGFARAGLQGSLDARGALGELFEIKRVHDEALQQYYRSVEELRNLLGSDLFETPAEDLLAARAQLTAKQGTRASVLLDDAARQANRVFAMKRHYETVARRHAATVLAAE